MNFLQYTTPEELLKETGMTVKQALQIVDNELKKIGEESNGIKSKQQLRS